jgi:hypothetical protein
MGQLQSRCCNDCSDTASQLGCGFVVNEIVYFSGVEQVFGNGDRLAFGLQGVVVGDGEYIGFVAVLFDGHKDFTNAHCSEVCRQLPVIPGGYELGERVFWTRGGEKLHSGDRLHFGLLGEIVGRSTQGTNKDDESVAVHFDGNRKVTDVLLSSISRKKPTIMGGYSVGDRVYFLGARQGFPNGDRLFFGLSGEIKGPVPVEEGGQRIAVLFDGNRMATPTCFGQIMSSPPTLPGGYTVGSRVYWAGKPQTLSSGDTLTQGLEGEVVGRAFQRFDGKDDERMLVLFQGHCHNTPVHVRAISRECRLGSQSTATSTTDRGAGS